MISHSRIIGIIAGDGIGPEVIAEAVKVLNVVAPNFELNNYDLGAKHWLRTGEILPATVLTELSKVDAIILGAVGADPRSKKIPSGLLEKGLLLKLRFTFDYGVNLRPNKLYAGLQSPLNEAITNKKEIDFIVVREGTEGLYCATGGSIRTNTANEIANEVSVNTAYGIERVIKFAFDKAQKRNKHLTLIHKNNVLVHAGALWSRIFNEVGKQYPEVKQDYLHVDAATIALVTKPEQFDVIVTDNLFGDIITDLASAITGGIGLGASANINTEGKYPAMFEPVHGSAPDIAGKAIADPRAAIISVSLLLDHLGYGSAAKKVISAVETDFLCHQESRPTNKIGDDIAALLA